MQKEEKKSAPLLALFKGNTKLFAIIPLIILGAMLIFFGSSGERAEETPKKSEEIHEITLEEYAESLENDIKDLCSGVRGVGSIRVAVSFSSDFEYVYAKNESDKGDGRTEQSYLTVGSGGSEGTVFLTRIPPKLSGVGIVCVGGGDSRVQSELVRLISAAYGVSSNRIYVSEAKNSNG